MKAVISKVKPVFRLMFVAVVLVAAVGGCNSGKDKEERKVRQDGPNEIRYVEVNTVNSKWKAVSIDVVNKKRGGRQGYSIPLGGRLELPDSKIVIEASTFYPDYVLEKGIASSKSDKINNPAVKLRITDDGKQMFSGWLFGRMPTPQVFSKMNYEFFLVGCTPPQ